MKRNNKKGFTIVELVIVIAVIGILATVMIPVFGNVIDNANENAAKAEARNGYNACYSRDIVDGKLDKAENGVAISDAKYVVDTTNGTATYTATKGNFTYEFDGTTLTKK